MMKYRWYIFLANLDPVVGSEQGKTRPVLVVSEEEVNQILPVVNVLPVTSRKPGRKIYPNEILISSKIGGLEKESIVLCYQIRTLDKRRLIKEIGRIEDLKLQEEITDALCFQLGIIRWKNIY
ncbi:type II toxin-antitoxin system PemK/MazF family toxin [Candidatus Desantisbacteria bacterium]|nr:type II toxin-antitoxin system PemK/MazF family toxin [Candidatus Desantisbacteria bacterium]